MADGLRALLGRLGAGPAAVMGHSMGGKVAMMLALTAPELVERLIVVDIAPVLYDKPGVLVYADTLRRLDLSGLSRRGDRKSVGQGKGGAVRVDHGGRRIIKKKNQTLTQHHQT